MPYRIKHKKSGLYYCPARILRLEYPNGDRCHVKSNISQRGKIYHIATLKWLKYGYYSHLEGYPQKAYGKQKVLPFIADEWEIEEMKKIG